MQQKDQRIKLLHTEGLSTRQIAQRLQVSQSYIQKRLLAIKKNENKVPQEKIGGLALRVSPQLTSHNIRLHKLQYNIKILNGSNSYKKKIGKVLKYEEATLVCHPKSISVHVVKDFIERNVDECNDMAYRWLIPFLSKVEQRLYIIILKDSYTNIKLVRSEYAELNNGLAQETLIKKQKLCYKGEDGKEWLKVDFSKQVPELETVHPQEAIEDMAKLKPFFDDLRRESGTLSELRTIIKTLADFMAQSQQTILVNAQSVGVITEVLKTILTPPVQDPMVSTLNDPLDKPSYIL